MSLSQEVDTTLKNSLLSENFSNERNLNLIKNYQRQLAWNDYKEGVTKWRIWIMLASQDIQLRYRRSVLGPFWITISMAITVYSMGYLYAKLFHVNLTNYYPFLVSGILCWTLISTIITEVADGLTNYEGLIKQVKLPYTLYLHRIAYRNLLIFFHNILVMFPILIIYHHSVTLNKFSFLLIPGLFLIYINTISYGLIIAMLGARYRDIGQVVRSLIQVVFFITPIMWTPNLLGENNQMLILLNPIYPFLEIIRQPILGLHPAWVEVFLALIITLLGFIISVSFFIKYRARIIYWV